MTRADAPIPVLDPMLLNMEFPLAEQFFPLGFPLRLAANHPEVLAGARESWGLFPPIFDVNPVEVRFAVTAGRSGVALPAPVFLAQRHLISMVGDAANFAVCDYTQSFGYGWITQAVVEHRAWFRWYYLDALVYMLLAQLHLAPVHAACVSRHGHGVLICGVSGAGKSTLAYACARSGWTYVADDSSMLVRKAGGRRVVGKPHHIRFRETAGALFQELGGRLASRSMNRKLTIEIPTAELPGIQTALTCEVSRIVFLNRDGRPDAQLVPIDRPDALQRLLRDLVPYHRPVFEEQVRTLENLIEVPSLELRYGDLDAAVRELELLVSN